jgi:hypothetical protein
MSDTSVAGWCGLYARRTVFVWKGGTMGNIPWHPMVLAVALPLVLIGLWSAIRREWLRPQVWWLGVVVAALLFGSSLVAVKTGEWDEEIVEEVVLEAAIHTHEERGEAFLWITGGLLIVTLLPAIVRRKGLRSAAMVVAFVASVGGAGFAVALGHSGGSLVYEHNAAAAHVRQDPIPQQVGARERECDDER